MLRKNKVALIGLLLAFAIAVPVIAYMYRTEPKCISSGVTLASPTLGLGLYWDQECTSPATVIDFGQIIQPNEEKILGTYIYIRNEGDVRIRIYWNSTLRNETTEIDECWNYGSQYWCQDAINRTYLDPGQVRSTFYRIKIPEYTTIGTYNWTLTVWGEY